MLAGSNWQVKLGLDQELGTRPSRKRKGCHCIAESRGRETIPENKSKTNQHTGLAFVVVVPVVAVVVVVVVVVVVANGTRFKLHLRIYDIAS